MGEHGGWVQPSGLLPNGLLPNQGSSVTRTLDSASWMKAEERTAELITCIQPNQPSEERRNAVADYVQRLIIKCFPCQVFTFGSVPLKTYLPDGDIDLTAFSNNQSLKDTWANKVRDILEEEETNEGAEFNVKEVQYIQAEVKIIKCLVENIVVDISFNQLGGLCTLCFLEEVDHLINQNHLFKRSIMLIKAWCYYESRILGAHHGLISTYALETLVLYIFHVFNSSFTGPLEVLYRFLEFFSNFDWDNFCVSLWGPVPISSLPDVSAEPPRKDSGELLLSKLFLDACSSVYAVFPSGQDNQGQPFISKHFNVIDPLRINNNLGRSVSKGNFFRIRSAFAFGAEKLAKVVECSKEKCVSEVNRFFNNTWDRHSNGRRPDILSSVPRPLNQQQALDFDLRSSFLSQSSDFPVLTRPKDTSPSSPFQRSHGGLMDLKADSDMASRTSSIHPSENPASDFQRRNIFARTRSSPELSDARSRGRQNVTVGIGNGHALPTSTRKKLQGQESGTGKTNPRKSEDGCADGENSTEWQNHQEEQDLVKMAMPSSSSSSSTAHRYNSPVHIPLPFPVSPSALSLAGYPQRTAMVPANLPLAPGGQFAQGFVHPSHYFPAIDLSPNHGSFTEPGNETFSSAEDDPRESDWEFWHENDTAGNDGILEMLQLEENQHAGSSGRFYKQQLDSANENHSDSYEYRGDLAGGTSSEYRRPTGDGAPQRALRPARERRGRKTEYRKGKGLPEGPPDMGDWRNRYAELDSSQASTSDPAIPLAPVMVGPGGGRQRAGEDPGVVPFTFYPTGPPVPFLTMLPVYNFPDGSTGGHFGGAENGEDVLVLDGDGSEMGSSRTDAAVGTPYGRNTPDILTSDFTSHWQNLQFGRLCQNPPRLHRPVVYQPQVVVPPVYLHGHFLWDGPGRPVSQGNANFFTQIMGYAPPRFIPVPPNRPSGGCRGSGGGGGGYGGHMDEIPRYRSGTGTYLPNPKVSGRDRHNSGSRRAGYNQERGGEQQSEREGNWGQVKSRAGGWRNHGRAQAEKHQVGRSDRHAGVSETRACDRQWDRYPSYSRPSHETGQVHPTQTGPSVAYGGVCSDGSPLQSLVMFYPYDQAASAYALPELTWRTSEAQQRQQGGDGARVGPGIYYEEQGSPDRPSSPHNHHW